MKQRAIRIVKLIALTILISGCATHTWKSNPKTKKVENEYFSASITAPCNEYWGCRSFQLTVKNKTNKNLELDWNKTLYVANGQTHGGFMFEGILYRDRNNQKQPDIIFPNGELSKTIWPNVLVDFYGSSWTHDYMPLGENGIYLTTKIGNKQISQKLTVKLLKVEIANSK